MIEMIFLTLAISLLIQIIMFVPAFAFKTDKLTDLSYSIGFIILALIILINQKILFGKLILLLMIFLWAFRLGSYLFIRINKTGKDKRFDGIRENFFKFLGFWIVQGILIWIILFPSLIYFQKEILYLSIISYLGILIWLKGILFETIADYQKFSFKNKKENKNQFVSSGLWKYSRHPNYYGEMLVWVGVYIFTFSSLNLIEKIIGLISPLGIILILLFFSGVPTVEKRMNIQFGKNKDYLKYKKQTSLIIPCFKKK